jgi:hypothetical protein
VYLKKQQLVGIISASVIIHFREHRQTNWMDIGLGVIVWAVIIHFRRPDKTDNGGTYNNSTAIGQEQQ